MGNVARNFCLLAGALGAANCGWQGAGGLDGPDGTRGASDNLGVTRSKLTTREHGK